MQKNEIVHLHSLFQLLRRQFEPTAEFVDESFAEYESLNVAPTHIHKSKHAHREAVFALSETLTSELAGKGKYSMSADSPDRVATEW